MRAEARTPTESARSVHAWVGFLGGGVALALAIMCKGPVALLQTALPIALYLVWRRWKLRELIGARFWMPMVCAMAMVLVVAIPWFAAVAILSPEVWRRWMIELTKAGVKDVSPDPMLIYFMAIPLMLPWIVPLIGGMIGAAHDAWRGIDRRIVLTLFLFVIPFIAMSFFHDRKDRYALPMIPAASVIVGATMNGWLSRRGRAEKMALAAHKAMVGVIAVGFPIGAAAVLKTANELPWLSWTYAMLVGALMLGLLLAARGFALVIVTVIVMLIAQAVFMGGYARSRAGTSEMKPLADAIVAAYPDAAVYNGRKDDKRISVDLAIYLNRATIRDDQWRELPRGDRPRVVVLQQKPNEPDPQPPAGWNFVKKMPRDTDWWWVFVQDAR